METTVRGFRSWIVRLALGLAWWIAGRAVDRFVCRTPETSAPIQVAVCVAFGALTSLALLELAAIAGFRARSRWEFLLPAAAYALVWGRHHFLNFSYWDEIVRFAATRRSPGDLVRTLFQPLSNGHLMPLTRLYWYAINFVFRSKYIGVAAASFVLVIACVASAHALLRFVAPARPRFLALVAATLLAATPHSPIVTLWKGADSLLLSMAPFLASTAALAGAVLGRIEFDRRTFAWITAGMIASLLSSELMAAAPIFLLPIGLWLPVRSARPREVIVRSRTLLVVVAAFTLGYWWVRQSLLGMHFPAASWTWASLAGALRGALEVFFPSPVVLAAFAIGLVYMALGRTSRSARVVCLFGIAMFLVGTMQVVVARGMDYGSRTVHSEYHLFLAYWGLALACASMVVAAGEPLAGSIAKHRVAGAAIAAAGLAIYCAFQHVRVERLWPVMTAFPLEHACAPEVLPSSRTRISVIHARQELREDLRRYVDGATAVALREGCRKVLPDLALVDSPRFAEFVLWPQSMNSDPRFGEEYRRMSRLRYLLGFFGPFAKSLESLPLRLVPFGEIDRAALASLYREEATGPFLQKYWPQLDPGGAH